MKTKVFKVCIFVLFIAFGVFQILSAAENSNNILKITLDDDIINPVSAEFISTAIDRAEKEDAPALIIELDTPGGLLTSTRTIVKKIMGSKVPVVVYVSPMGARAGSAGVFITLAAHVAVMAPSTNIGAAHPVEMNDKRDSTDAMEELLKAISGKDDRSAKKVKKTTTPMDDKILNDTKAWAEAIARERGRNAHWAIKAVTESVSVADTEAMKIGIIDFIARDEGELLLKLDGRSVVTGAGTVVIKTAGKKIVEIKKTFRERMLAVLAHPNIAYILMMLGFYGLLFEFTHPGVVFPGVAGAICLILAFFGLQVLPTNYAGVALIVLAISMFIAEIKVVSYGLLTIGGVIALFLGSFMLFSSPYDFMRVSIPIIAAFTLATLIIAAFLTYIVVRMRKKKVATGVEGMVGLEGEVISFDGTVGKVMVHGEIWSAQCSDALSKGDRVEVLKVNGMFLIVKKSHRPESTR